MSTATTPSAVTVPSRSLALSVRARDASCGVVIAAEERQFDTVVHDTKFAEHRSSRRFGMKVLLEMLTEKKWI